MYSRRPLTKLESGIYAGIVAIMLTVFARQALDYMEIAERAAMQATLSNAVAAINFRLGYNLLTSGAPQDVDWVTRNPFEIARMSPPSSWDFDTATGELVYHPRLGIHLETENKEGWIRFRLQRQPAGKGYMLVPTTPYRWEW